MKKQVLSNIMHIKANVIRMDSVLQFVRKTAPLRLWYPSELYFHSCKAKVYLIISVFSICLHK